MNILQLERERTTLKEKLTAQYSAQARVIFLYEFFDKILATGNNNFIDSYLPEFIPEYVFCLKNFSVLGMKPGLNESIIQQAEQIKNSGHTSGFEEFSVILTRLKNDLEKLQKILNGLQNEAVEAKAYFPLLEEEAIKETGLTIGILESVTIKIHPAKKENKFIIVPSEKEIEEKISEQVKLSWLNAVRIAKKYIKRIHPYHEVIISFDKKAGFCKGNSLGTALTLSFIVEIFKTYNSPLSIKVGDGIAFTGGMDEQGKITVTSEEIIKQKTELIFFSDISLFIVPKKEESAANEKLNELRKEFPRRDLKITGMADINDLLDRRTIVEIKKQPVIVRTGKFVKKNWEAFSLMLIIAGMIYFTGWWDFDSNPKVLKYENQHIRVFNVNGKLLWSKKVRNIPSYFLDGTLIKKQFALIADVTGDGKNEVILSNKLFGQRMHDPEFNNIVCYDYAKRRVWKHTFAEVVSTNTITFSSEYRTKFIDIYELNNQRILFVVAKNYYFPSAVFGVDITTGERATEVFWHSGHLDDGLIYEDSSENSDKLIVGGVNNGFESASLAVLEISKLAGQAPTSSNYNLNDITPADLLEYILIPPSDYSSFKNSRYNAVMQDHLKFEDKKIRVGINELAGLGEPGSVLFYYFNPDFTFNFIETGDNFQHERDRLVREGKLSPPRTYTPEYFEILKNNIRYWDGKKFVTR